MLIDRPSLVEVAVVANVKDAQAIAQKFNAFHDGILKEIVLVSADEIDSTGAQSCTGEFSLRGVFLHHNFHGAEHGYQQCVEVVFLGVRDLLLLCSGRPVEWGIFEVTFKAASPVDEADVIACSVSVDCRQGDSWSQLTVLSFTFERATFSVGKLAGPLITFESSR